eukprot:CAMPEP_0172471352 /NCGR_PEP_ID=MMETSP1065-20121228/67769_1 /TAXON_ID=265537 /ORGANISM="Amphiprora paludosa, Strain CCMP125" /LENGTH=1212 /DNA_ID=CAMNT_0013229447 /DNA_START=86 /DNA_END=3721 /DNA_ORIENTATION=-
MIVVFVVDNSPSMALPAYGESGMSRLDLAKMAVEDISRQLRRRQTQHVKLINEESSMEMQRSYVNLGLGASHPDQLLLLSTARQFPETAACAAGGRLLVGFGSSLSTADQSNNKPSPESGDTAAAASMDDQYMMEAFHRQLKGLRAASWDASSGKPFPEEAGGATGLNAALSTGLQLLSRYRLQSRYTENFGLGRLPNPAITTSATATGALQPACLIILTDGACLRQPPKMGGGQLQLQYGAQPLREFYTEPFRWDQRIFCLGVGAKDGISSTQYLHPQLRAFCEVTGGSHWVLRKAVAANLSQITEAMLKRFSPPLPREIPLPDPLLSRNHPSMIPNSSLPTPTKTIPGLSFVHGGPVVALQALEPDEVDGQQRAPKAHRAILLYVGAAATAVNIGNGAGHDKYVLSPPLWCIPEAHFPSKKLDTLPPRKAQPHLFFSRYPSNLGSKSFEPGQIIKMLQKLDQLTMANRKHVNTPQLRCLHRDTYVCEWLSPEGGKPVQVAMHGRQEFFPVFCPGAGRPSLSAEEGDNYLNIGILHVPSSGSSTLAASANASRLASLTLLPPDPHILLPLLIRAAEAEHRVIKKLEGKGSLGKGITSAASAKINVPLDESWRNEIRAYLFRLPPYYQPALRRALRPIMPSSANNLLQFDASPDAIVLQCFSKVCLQKIRNGEQVAKDNNDRLERQEVNLRSKRGSQHLGNRAPGEEKPMQTLRYGQYDPRGSLDSYLAALRNMPPPWRAGPAVAKQRQEEAETLGLRGGEAGKRSPTSVLDLIGDLPKEGLMAFYESRRRWIFGGTGLSTRGIHVEGVNYDGSNSQRCDTTPKKQPECPLSLAGVGVSTVNQTTTSKMGDYRERLLFSKPPIVGYGSNDFAGVASTTAVDGSPKWSVDDDALPMAFFDPVTGEFQDSVQARVRSRLMVNFGNPYKEKRADSMIPERFMSHAPSMERGLTDSIASPPHDSSFDSVEEGEAVFVMKSPSRTSPKREEIEDSSDDVRPSKKQKSALSTTSTPKVDEKPPPPPKPPARSDGNIPESSSLISSKKGLMPSARPPPPKPPPTSVAAPPPPKHPGASHSPKPMKAGSKVAPPPKPPGRPAAQAPPPPKPTNPPKPPVPAKRPAPPKPPPQGSSARPPPPPPKPGAAQTGPPQGKKLQSAASNAVPPPIAETKKPEIPNPATSTALPAEIKRQTSSGSVSSQDLQRQDVKPDVELPQGW